MTKNEIEEIRVEIDAGDENALSMTICRDGTLGRRGSGQVPAVPAAILGMTDAIWFTQLLESLDERIFLHSGSYDLPDKSGIPVTYTIVFLGGNASERKVLCGFRFLTGSAAKPANSLLSYFDGFVGKCVQLTEQWYQDGLSK